MILGMTTFTAVHVLISLIAIVSGLVVLPESLRSGGFTRGVGTGVEPAS